MAQAVSVVEIERERPITDRIPVDGVRDASHAVRERDIVGRIPCRPLADSSSDSLFADWLLTLFLAFGHLVKFPVPTQAGFIC